MHSLGKGFWSLLTVFFAVGMLTMSCGSSNKVVQNGEAKRYERKPIVERSEEQLRTEAMMIDAKLRQETGQTEQAEKLLRGILAQEPQNAAACYELSRILAAKGENDSAIAFAQRAENGDG